jgi:FMN phosphatase YigB (HAD superfamily)
VRALANNKIKAVLFDLGETLLTFGKVNKARIYRQGAASTYDFLKSQGQPVGNFKYYYWRNLLLLRIRHWMSCIIGRDFDALEVLKKSGTKRGIKLTDQQWQHLVWLWYEPLSKVGKAELKMKETLTTLKKLGLKLGIVSNTFVNAGSLDKHLEQLGILDFFQVRLYSY